MSKRVVQSTYAIEDVTSELDDIISGIKELKQWIIGDFFDGITDSLGKLAYGVALLLLLYFVQSYLRSVLKSQRINKYTKRD